MRTILITGAAFVGIAIFGVIELQKNGSLSVADAIGAAVAVAVVIGAVFAINRRRQ